MTVCNTPDFDCALCPRLKKFRVENRIKFPDEFNAPVPSFGSDTSALLVVGLAPGLRGANFTGRPFTADYAGDLLYPTLKKFGFAKGNYDRRADDGFTLVNTRITNAVRCVPPENKPTTAEINTCRDFLISEINSLKNLKVILALGGIAHKSVIKTFNQKQSAHPFGHGTIYDIDHNGKNIKFISSYHCSRYNTNTGRLTTAMFEDVVKSIQKMI